MLAETDLFALTLNIFWEKRFEQRYSGAQKKDIYIFNFLDFMNLIFRVMVKNIYILERGVFRIQLNICSGAIFRKELTAFSRKPLTIFAKKLHLRFLIGFSLRFC